MFGNKKLFKDTSYGLNLDLVLENPARFRTFNLNLSERMLPDIFLIGAQKAGTTSILLDLLSHPDVAEPRSKEVFFLNDTNNWGKGVSWYKSHFPKVNKSAKKITIDASANYFESKIAPKRLMELNPRAKVIVVLRNPVDRAYSHYQMAKALGFEKLAFLDALKMEESRIKFGEELAKKLGHNYIFQKCAYAQKGKYPEFLKPWSETFNNLHLIQTEHYFKNQAEEYLRLLRFLELENFTPKSFNWAKKRNYSEMGSEAEIYLKEFYTDSNEVLYNITGIDYR